MKPEVSWKVTVSGAEVVRMPEIVINSINIKIQVNFIG
jgi:hypothetical protein